MSNKHNLREKNLRKIFTSKKDNQYLTQPKIYSLKKYINIYIKYI